MGHTIFTFLLLILATLYIDKANACEVQGVANWWLDLSVLDTDRGLLFQGDTTGIQSLVSAQHSGEGLNSGPYFVATFVNSQFTLTLSENFAQYEEFETSSSMSISATFGCTNGNSLNIVFIVSIVDTNNNAPVFAPSNEISFTVTPPLPPGYQVTGCFSAINVRDIDLTTQRIEFNIEPNDYFEIEYDAASSTEAKLFGAVLRTTSFVRSLSEPVTLWISATDVDLTGDAPLTTNATIRIEADGDFEFPDQPVFSQVFYRANYTDEHQLVLAQPIYLNEGYHISVGFSMTGEYVDYFTLIPDGNQLNVEVASQLPVDLLQSGQIVLELFAEREYTSGATATLIISLPEEPKLEFTQQIYRGTITDGILDLGEMSLTSGFENGFDIAITGDHAAYFIATTEAGTITISLNNILESILEENSFLTLEVTASNEYSSDSSTVLLDIIKNDTLTPLFEENAYIGNYGTENGLQLEPIILVQGFDDTITFSIEGDYSNLFTFIQNGNGINLQVAGNIPDAILESVSHILLNVVAKKPRTVGANTAVSISLPTARELGFEQNIYTGQLNEDLLTIETILLITGYGSDVNFSLSGDFSSYFILTNDQNVVTLNIAETLPSEVILENSFLTLVVEASGFNALPATANIVLDIIKEDTVTPVFNKLIYYGTYEGNTIDIENISLSQGYGSDVNFQLVGEYSSYFDINNYENQVILTILEDIPNELIFNEKVLSFSIVAEKPLTVGANAAITINFPEELTDATVLRFAQNNYVGTFEDNTFTMPNIILEQGYSSDTTFLLTGDQAEYFTISNEGNVISVSLSDELPAQATENNILILEIAAERERAVSTSTTIIIDIITTESVTLPIFEQVLYSGVYTVSNGLSFNETIRLAQGFDDTITFTLQGDNSQWFMLDQDNNSVNLILNGDIPEQLVYENRQFVLTIKAEKPDTINAEAVILIDLPEVAPITILGFSEISYVGSIENGILEVEPITLVGTYYDNLNFTIYGEYSTYFSVSLSGDTVAIALSNEFPIEELRDLAFIVVDIEVSRPDSISGFTSTVLEIINEAPVVPVFDRTYYAGSYSENNGLTFDYTMLLLQGFDDTVGFSLEGEGSQWFTLSQSGNNLTLSVTSESPQFEGRRHLLFSVVAEKPTTIPGSAAIVITLEDEDEPTIIRFDQTYYLGQLQNGSVSLGEIIISEGYTDETTITLSGDLQNYFEITNNQGVITIQVLAVEQDLLETSLIIFEIQASSTNSMSGFATIILQNYQDNLQSMEFAELYYTGSYTETDSFVFDGVIVLDNGYDNDVTFTLEGGNTQWFELIQNGNELIITLASLIPGEILSNNHNLIFSITASRNGAVSARVPIIISLLQRDTSPFVLAFEDINYIGTISNQQLELSNLMLSEGYSENVTFILSGEFSSHFLFIQDGPNIVLDMQNSLHENLPDTNVIVMELTASGPNMITAHTTIVLEILRAEAQLPVFSSTYYIGEYSMDSELVFDSNITLVEGYDETVTFELEGDQSQWFILDQSDNAVLISASDLPEEILSTNNHLVFILSARKPGFSVVRATIIISLDSGESIFLRFERNNYVGQINNGTSSLEPINLIQGYNDNVVFSLFGDLASYFTISNSDSIVTIILSEDIPQNALPNNNLVILDVEATAPQSQSKYATVIFTIVPENNITSELYLEFSQAYYAGSYSLEDSLDFEHRITLSEGYDDDVIFALEGENVEWFLLTGSGNNISITLNEPLPTDVLANNQKIIFTLTAEKLRSNTARTAIIIALTDSSTSSNGVSFERALYSGILEQGSLQHEVITITGFNGTDIDVSGEYSELFEASVSSGIVVVQTAVDAALPESTVYAALELSAAGARTALIIDVIHSETPVAPPVITFSSPSYDILTDVSQTGLIGRVQATADNGERILYNIETDNVHLQERLSISEEGDLHLFAPANSGFYSFAVVASTAVTQVAASAAVRLTVEVITECVENGTIGVPPLVILERDEEEPHEGLLVISGTDFIGCHYILSNRYPPEQNWLYIDERGLHARPIDREDESIAFMALSQIQVELTLQCENDDTSVTRTKRSVNEARMDWLGPYDYGNSKWILSDSISYNPRRTFVNLIVNDINDNSPIFKDKENEPIAVGHPSQDIIDVVIPKTLVELQATDADIGFNAALTYSSTNPEITVSPSTGSVHIRDNVRDLVDGSIFTVEATDQLGEGLTGNIQIMLRLLNVNQIAVVTVRNAFLDDEQAVLHSLTDAIGYEVKALSSAVISDEYENLEELQTRIKRQTTENGGASLKLYVYGLIEKTPVEVEQLTSDINTNLIASAVVAGSISLQDYLESLETCVIADSGRDTGLLIATIVLSILLFILIVLIALWFFLKWRKETNYDHFSDQNSLASKNELVNVVEPKPEITTRPRLNIEELKRSERRLQEMLDAPVNEIVVEPSTSKTSLASVPLPPPLPPIALLSDPDNNTPIVIQSIDKLKTGADESDGDEYGEINIQAKRKSVVTFNENVEKIIQFEDRPEDVDSIQDIEIERL